MLEKERERKREREKERDEIQRILFDDFSLSFFENTKIERVKEKWNVHVN